MSRLKFKLIIQAVLFGVFVGLIPTALALRIPANDYEFFDPLVDVGVEIFRNYVETPDREKMLNGAIGGMIDSLNDDYTDYFTPESLQDFDKQTRATFSGIGATINVVDNQLTIVSPTSTDSPAYKAGIVAGDVILEIDGKATDGMSSAEAVKLITGPEGTDVVLKIRHPDGQEVVLTLTRSRIEIPTVKGFRLDGKHDWDFMLDHEAKIGYVRIEQFSDPTAGALVAAIDELNQQGMKGLILDLRSDPGGLLDSAIQIADLFLTKGRIVSTRGRNSPERTWDAGNKDDVGDFPLIVMVNELSASASEIVAGALKDNNRAIILGTRTFGKGSVQQVIGLESGLGAIKVTTAHYYLPSGRNLHRREGAEVWGVDPNEGFYIPLSPDQLRKIFEARSDADVIKADNGADQPQRITPQWINEHLADPQLAGAVTAMLGKLETGEFTRVGESNATLQAHLTEKAALERQRDRLIESLDAINTKIDELQKQISKSAEPTIGANADEAEPQARRPRAKNRKKRQSEPEAEAVVP